MPLPGGDLSGGDLSASGAESFGAFRDRFQASAPVDRKSADHLLALYGTRAQSVLEIASSSDDPELLQPFDEHTGAIGAEIISAFRDEFARTLVDVLFGRTMVDYDAVFDARSAEAAAKIAARHLGWDDARCTSELDAWRRHARKFEAPAGASDAP